MLSTLLLSLVLFISNSTSPWPECSQSAIQQTPVEIPIEYPRSVVLLKTYVTLDQNGSLNRSTFTTNYYASPGDSVCIVDNIVYRKSTLNGQITDYYDIEYSLR